MVEVVIGMPVPVVVVVDVVGSGMVVVTLVVGVDGLEWSVLRPLLEQGRCPELAALMERGSFGRLLTLDRTLSPVVWTSIVSYVALMICKATVGLRVKEQEEREGLDLADHGERAYN